eukprot:TRINITY_DN16929_c0_g1_i1.p1 TRINITY_DN16929_c0_g1~~TRINITY_DN16929_c0_g1_i1.p1  ORF type:complete len:332 (+),score=59.32 TRINITY_DN16929_c0_g1_i1:84-1079(+)
MQPSNLALIVVFAACASLCTNAAVFRVSMSTNTSRAGDYGKEGCPCIGIDELDGETTVTPKAGSKVAYPADLGARCEAWDESKHPECPGESWCKSQWCYVDPCNCKGVSPLPKPSNYLPGAKYQGKPLHFSYATCGGSDSYSAEEDKKTVKDIEETCAVKVDSSKWGDESCRCVGIGPQPGTTKVAIDGKLVDFPADTGSMCQAWEKGNHPQCSGKSPPSWCSQAWCYVDPCKCKLATPPKTSGYLPDSNFQGKPVFFSYATCGGSDSYTASELQEACVNQKTSEDCGKLEKCAWNGKGCLGKALVDVCQSGAWSPKAIMALSLPLLGLMC